MRPWAWEQMQVSDFAPGTLLDWPLNLPFLQGGNLWSGWTPRHSAIGHSVCHVPAKLRDFIRRLPLYSDAKILVVSRLLSLSSLEILDTLPFHTLCAFVHQTAGDLMTHEEHQWFLREAK